jgi:hypothetical protein
LVRSSDYCRLVRVARSDKVGLVQFCVQDRNDLVTPDAAGVCTASTVLLIDLILICFSGSRHPLSLLRWYGLFFVQLCVQDYNDMTTPAGDLLGLVDDGLNIGQELGLLPSSQSNTKRQCKSYSVLCTRL